ncbi:MAG: heparinase II/III family protein [Caldilineaceae bacterium]|nr:heparinase II/III family protein [Caldilineaceae bacterium]
MLAERFTADLSAHLQSRNGFKPVPTIEDRGAWEGLPASVRAAHIARGEEALGYAYPGVPATVYLQFARMGNRSNYEELHFDRRHTLETLTLAECMEGQGRFLDDIVNGIWCICEESSWCLPAHISVQRAGKTLPDTAEPIVDLFAAETSALLAWVLYLLGDRLDGVSPLVRPRMEREIQQRVLIPCTERDDFWWMGLVEHPNRGNRRVNNWNPWICSNWLASALIVEPDDDVRTATVTKIMRCLDKFIDPYPRDGGCDEGPNYWGRAGASLFDNLELLLAATDGWIDVYGEPLVQEIGRYIYRAHIDDDFYLNFADASAIVHPEALLVYRYGQRIADDHMIEFGRWLAHGQNVLEVGAVQGTGTLPPSLGRAVPDLFVLADAVSAPGQAPRLRDVWLPDIEVMVARDTGGSSDGLYLAAKGGHNDESHNHNDIGNFVVFVDGKPLLVDAGVETYTAKTFSETRYEIWTMQSAYHSLLPTVDGVQQEPGHQFAARNVAYAVDDAQAQLSLDIALAYPPTAKLATWQRMLTLTRGEQVEIVDDFRFTAPVGTVELTLLTPCAVDLDTRGVVVLGAADFGHGKHAGAGRVEYDGDVFAVRAEIVPITDERMGPVWGDHLTRIVFRTENPPMEGQWRFRALR